jgi:tetratricopeptide (TPR) repeat protein
MTPVRLAESPGSPPKERKASTHTLLLRSAKSPFSVCYPARLFSKRIVGLNLAFISIIFGLLAVPSPAVAQEQSGNVILDSSETLFDVLAALEASGYNAGDRVDTGGGTREAVRDYLSKQNLPVRKQLSLFYSNHQVPDDPGEDLGQYISLALLLGPAPDFKPSIPIKDLPPDAKAVAGVIPLLKAFYNQANLLNLWAHLEPKYQLALDRYREPVRRDIVLSDAYLRFPAGSYLGRTYSIFITLLGAPGQVQGRIYGDNYYLVVTPSKDLKLYDIRHQYLHFLLDPLAVKYGADIEEKAALQTIARRSPALGDDFKNDFSLLVTECLIHAVELRMDKPKDAKKRADQDLATGLILTPYFYATLGAYEKQPAAMSIYYKQLIEGIHVKKFAAQFADYKFAPPAPSQTVPKPVLLSQQDQLVEQGDNLIYQGKYQDAEAVFSEVLQKFDPHSARALYGMAVAAANTRKPDTAEKYFRKTLAVARDVRIVTWSHIYLGRLYDLEDRRQEALEQYRAASLTAANFPEAVRAVQAGLRLPYGVK